MATLILLLVTSCVTVGVSAAVRQYNQAMRHSEAAILCASLTEIVQNELSTTYSVHLDDDGTLIDYYSTNYADTYRPSFFSVKKNNGSYYSVGVDEFGELLLGMEKPDSPGEVTGKLPLSSGAYSKYRLGARVSVRAETEGTQVSWFHVTLKVGDDRETLIESEFDVLPLDQVWIQPPDG